MKSAAEKSKWRLYVVAGGVLALFGFLCLITTMSSDDYWYSTFFYDGLPAYFRLLAEHYHVFNGRTLVHAFAQIVLYAGNWLFLICGVALVTVIPFLSAKACCTAEEKRSARPLVAVAIFAAGVLALPLRMLVEGVLWISAFFNYVLPSAMLVGAIYLLEKTRNKTPGIGGYLGICVYFFLCGATTEQSGAVTVAITTIFCVELALREKKLRLWNLAFIGFSVLGLATVLLSPATQQRFAREVSGKSQSLFAVLGEGLSAEADFFSGDVRLFGCVVLLFLLFSGLVWMKTRRKGVPIGCGIFAVLMLSLHIMKAENVLIYVLILLGLAACAGWTIVTGHYPMLGYLLLAGLVSVGSVVFTASIAWRTMLPCALFLLACVAVMSMLLLERYPRGEIPVLLATAAIALTTFVPNFPGFWHNHQVEQENLVRIQEAAQSDELFIRMDYDELYTMPKMYDYPYYMDYFLEYSKVDKETTRIYLYAQNGFAVYFDGERMTHPAFVKDGRYYLPVRNLIESDGGTVFWKKEETTITSGGRQAFLQGNCFRYIDEAGSSHSIDIKVMVNGLFTCLPSELAECSHSVDIKGMGNGFMCLPSELFEDVFGLSVTINEEKQEIFVTRAR